MLLLGRQLGPQTLSRNPSAPSGVGLGGQRKLLPPPENKSSYHLMMKHLENYGDCNLEDITTEYIQNFITYLEKQGLQRGTVRLYFQKLACVLNDAYKNELFDERILRRVKRPKREQSKKSFLTERELKRLFSTAMPEKYDNMKNMFLFSCSTGLRFSDVANLQWKNVKTHNKHLFLELERLLCPRAP